MPSDSVILTANLSLGLKFIPAVGRVNIIQRLSTSPEIESQVKSIVDDEESQNGYPIMFLGQSNPQSRAG